MNISYIFIFVSCIILSISFVFFKNIHSIACDCTMKMYKLSLKHAMHINLSIIDELYIETLLK